MSLISIPSKPFFIQWKHTLQLTEKILLVATAVMGLAAIGCLIMTSKLRVLNPLTITALTGLLALSSLCFLLTCIQTCKRGRSLYKQTIRQTLRTHEDRNDEIGQAFSDLAKKTSST